MLLDVVLRPHSYPQFPPAASITSWDDQGGISCTSRSSSRDLVPGWEDSTMYRGIQHALLLTGGLFFVSGVSRAQTYLDLPRASQQAKVMQRIGLAEITINYSRPLVNGRKIWGGLEPDGNVWPAGAKQKTTLDVVPPPSGGG